MRALITGATGQLGLELQATAPANVEIQTPGRGQLELCDRESVDRCVADLRPQLVVNTAAYTAVDRAEQERDRATAVNARGARWLAEAAKGVGGRLIHVSTDFVFSGDASRPYPPEALTGPLGVYGESKRAGELAVQEATGGAALVVRTSWLYSRHGHNFVRTMLRLLAEREAVGVVADQVGSPTWARGLAEAIWGFAARPELSGTFHFADAGVASWYDLATSVGEVGEALGLIQRSAAIRPIATEDWPTAARRPAYSVLDSSATLEALELEPRHWRLSLRSCLEELAGA